MFSVSLSVPKMRIGSSSQKISFNEPVCRKREVVNRLTIPFHNSSTEVLREIRNSVEKSENIKFRKK